MNFIQPVISELKVEDIDIINNVINLSVVETFYKEQINYLGNLLEVIVFVFPNGQDIKWWYDNLKMRDNEYMKIVKRGMQNEG